MAIPGGYLVPCVTPVPFCFARAVVNGPPAMRWGRCASMSCMSHCLLSPPPFSLYNFHSPSCTPSSLLHSPPPPHCPNVSVSNLDVHGQKAKGPPACITMSLSARKSWSTKYPVVLILIWLMSSLSNPTKWLNAPFPGFPVGLAQCLLVELSSVGFPSASANCIALEHPAQVDPGFVHPEASTVWVLFKKKSMTLPTKKLGRKFYVPEGPHPNSTVCYTEFVMTWPRSAPYSATPQPAAATAIPNHF